MKASENNGRLFNGSALRAHNELERAEVHEDRAPINEVWKVCGIMTNLRKVLFEISIREWDTTSMESLYRLNGLICDASDMWAYICALDDECVKCNRNLIQLDMNRMIDLVAEICFNHKEEYEAYLNSIADNKTSTGIDGNNEREEKTMKASKNNGRLFNGSAYLVHRELPSTDDIRVDKIPDNQVGLVCETMRSLHKVIDEIKTEDWDTTSMESLYHLNGLIREAIKSWDYISLLDRECVKCDRLLIQSELNHMLTWVFEESCYNHRNEYLEYCNSIDYHNPIPINDTKTSSDSNDDVDTDTSDDSQSESDDKTQSFVDSILGTIEPISNNCVQESPSPVKINRVIKLPEPFDGGLVNRDDMFKHAAYAARHIYPRENNVPTTDEFIDWNDVFASIASRAWHFPDVGICTNENNEEHVEKKTRPSKDEYYLGIAEAVSARSTCLRIHYGSIICNNDRIVSSGYNGAPMGAPNCDEVGECYRVKNNIPHFTRYETCQSVHSEMNAIINASRTDMLGGTLYLVGKDVSSGSYVEGDCCPMCRRAVINAGISQVVFRTKDGGIRKVNVSDWTNDCMFNND